jgi:hypothetical protein
MAEFNIRSDAVDVEQIMRQIRARIQEKRGVDYTEEQIRELATVRLEKFLDPKNLRSDLLEQFRKSRPPVPTRETVELPYTFDDQTLFATHRGGLAFIRKLLRPVLKLFFNPNTLNQILHTQAQFNGELLVDVQRSRAEWNALYYEVLHNLVLEATRTGIEVKNLKMRVESLSSRLDFSERRVRALEGVVQYRPEAVRSREPRGIESEPAESVGGGEAPAGPRPIGEGGRRRRRRRRGRRGPGLGPGDATGNPQMEGAAEEPSMDIDSEPGGGAGDDQDFAGEPDSDANGPDEQ